jgi:type I restriction enzyme R subunit
MAENVQHDTEVRAIDVERALLADERVCLVTEHILKNFPLLTKRSSSFIHSTSYRNLKTGDTTVGSQRVTGFNALFATSSIAAARRYYNEFARQQEGVADPLKVAMIFSAPQHQELSDQAAGSIGEDTQDVDGLREDDRKALSDAVADYNEMFGTSFTATSGGFGNYYKDLSQRIRNREVDLVIVVNIFLTGFDAPALNTLFVDKNLRHHGLIQAFSRTNRILNPIKDSGVIVTYRDLSQQTDEALSMFGDGDKKSRVAVVRPYKELLSDYTELVEQLAAIAAPGELVYGEELQRQFVQIVSEMVRLLSVLMSFEQFEHDNPLSEYDFSNYLSRYLDIRDQIIEREAADDGSGPVDITEDLEFEIELIRHMTVNIDYISELLRIAVENSNGSSGQDNGGYGPRRRAEDAARSSPSLRPKRDLIQEFLDLLDGAGYPGTLIEFLQAKATEEITRVITDHRLSTPEAFGFVAQSFASGEVDTSGTALANLLPPMSLFKPNNARETAKQAAAKALEVLIERFGDVVDPQSLRNLSQRDDDTPLK